MFGIVRTRWTALWVLALIALVVNAVISIYNVLELIRNSERVEHSQQVLIQLRLVFSDIKDAETGQRGFLLTNDEDYLQPHTQCVRQIDERLRQLKLLTSDNLEQQASLNNLERIISEKLAELDFAIKMQRLFGDDFARFLVHSNIGKQRMDAARAEVARMEEREYSLLRERTAAALAKHELTLATGVVGGVLTIGMTGLAFLLIRRELIRRRKTEDALRQSTNELRRRANELSSAQHQTADFLTLLDHFFANTPIALAFLSPNLKVIRINHLFVDSIGHPAQAILNAIISDLSSPFVAMILPDLHRVVATRQAVLDRTIHLADDDHSKNRWWQVSCYPNLSSQGELLGVGVIGRDITNRVRNEQELRESQSRFRNLAEAMPQIVWVASPDGSHEYFNKRWYDYSGLTYEESVRWGWMRLVHPDDRDYFEQAWQRSIHNAAPLEVEYRLRGTDDRYRWFLARALPQRDAHLGIVNWFGTSTDIHDRKMQTQVLEELVQTRARELLETNAALKTEVEIRKEAERSERATNEELRRSNQELEQFAYVASHDLQEPLRKIQAFGDRLSKRFSGQLGEQGQEYLERVIASASRMRRLIDDLLTFSRVAARAQPFVEIDLGTIAREVRDDLEERINQTNGRIDIGPLPCLDGDPMQIRQLFTNLLANALKFHRPDVPPAVTIQAELFDEPAKHSDQPRVAMCRITIADNGIGFDNQFADRIFQIFQRLHGRNQFEGTGIGLAICRKIVERHAGRISASSNLGQGSTFVVELPLRQHNRDTGESGF